MITVVNQPTIVTTLVKGTLISVTVNIIEPNRPSSIKFNVLLCDNDTAVDAADNCHDSVAKLAHEDHPVGGDRGNDGLLGMEADLVHTARVSWEPVCELKHLHVPNVHVLAC